MRPATQYGVRKFRRTLCAMGTILGGLTLALIIVIAVPLAILRAGIRRQDRAASLTSRPSGLSAAVARRVLGLHASLPARPAQPADPGRQAGSEQTLITLKKGPAAS